METSPTPPDAADAANAPAPAPEPAAPAGAVGSAHAPESAVPAPPASAKQPRNPLHGLTLESIVTALVDAYGWAGLGERVPVRCFLSDPSVASSLKFLRKTPWAREKVESLYLYMLREGRREARTKPPTGG